MTCETLHNIHTHTHHTHTRAHTLRLRQTEITVASEAVLNHGFFLWVSEEADDSLADSHQMSYSACLFSSGYICMEIMLFHLAAGKVPVDPKRDHRQHWN